MITLTREYQFAASHRMYNPEWDDEKKNFLENGIEIINFDLNYFKYLPKIGFFKSRFSYFLIILTSIIPLLRLLIKDKPEFFVVHLITSLPLILMKLINTKNIGQVASQIKLPTYLARMLRV